MKRTKAAKVRATNGTPLVLRIAAAELAEDSVEMVHLIQ